MEKLILNFFYPNPEIILKTYGKEIKETIKTKDKKPILISKSYFADEVNQIVEFTKNLLNTLKNNKTI